MVEFQEIPPKVIVNWDQMGIKIVPVSSWTMAKGEARRVEIAGADDKRQIMTVFAATPTGNFLPPQVIYVGRTPAFLPRYSFLS